MTKQYAYVIKRSDSQYFRDCEAWSDFEFAFTNSLIDCVAFYFNEKVAKNDIFDYELKNCKIVKIWLGECEDE